LLFVSALRIGKFIVKRLVFFALGSTMGAVIDFCIAFSLLRLGFPGWLALALAMCVSATLVYVFHQRATFADLGTKDLSLGRLTMFLANTALVYGLRVLVFEGLRRAATGEAVALVVALLSSLLVSFVVSRLVIFQGSKVK
jgi:putative flippase GtrA